MDKDQQPAARVEIRECGPGGRELCAGRETSTLDRSLALTLALGSCSALGSRAQKQHSVVSRRKKTRQVRVRTVRSPRCCAVALQASRQKDETRALKRAQLAAQAQTKGTWLPLGCNAPRQATLLLCKSKHAARVGVVWARACNQLQALLRRRKLLRRRAR